MGTLHCKNHYNSEKKPEKKKQKGSWCNKLVAFEMQELQCWT
jgi:hypothetical protein